jgi:hypothetical protein
VKTNESNSEVIIDKKIGQQSEEEKVSQDDLIIEDNINKR